MSTRGFSGNTRPTSEVAARLPPGQHLTTDFPILTAGPTQHTALDVWGLTFEHGARIILNLDWQSFAAMPQTRMKADIHCVTTWSKLGTDWRGVTFDDLLRAGGITPEPNSFVMAHCDGGYTTNLPVADLTHGKGMVATHFEGVPLTPEHGAPARLLVPHLYHIVSNGIVATDDQLSYFSSALASCDRTGRSCRDADGFDARFRST